VSKAGRKSKGERRSKAQMMQEMRSRVDRGSDQMRMKRLQLAGDESVAVEFPLEVMFALGMLRMHAAEDPFCAEDRRIKGWQFAVLAWTESGSPLGAAGAWQKIISGFVDGGSFAGTSGGNEGAARRLKAMHAELYRPGESHSMLTAVKNVVQYLHLPRLVRIRREIHRPDGTLAPNPSAKWEVNRANEREVELVREGLQRLVNMDAAAKKAA